MLYLSHQCFAHTFATPLTQALPSLVATAAAVHIAFQKPHLQTSGLWYLETNYYSFKKKKKN